MYTEQCLVNLCSEVHISVLREIALVLQICSPNINFKSSFIENGGDSLSCITLQAALRNIGIDLPFETILTTKSIHELVQHAACRVNKAGTTKAMKRRLSVVTQGPENRGWKRSRRRSLLAGAGSKRLSMTSMQPERRYPMTDLQLSFIRSSLSYPKRNIIQYYETHRSEHISALKDAWHSVLGLEPIFRMRFCIEDGNGYMLQTRNTHFRWTELVAYSEDSFQEELGKEDWIDELQDGYPVNDFKVVIWQQKSTLIWRVHHSFVDEHSRNMLLCKVWQYLKGEIITASPSFGEYADQLRSLQQQFQDVGRTYWKKQQEALATATATLLLPAPATLPTKPLEHLEINAPVSELAALSKSINVTLACLYYAAWALTLTRYVDSDDVCFGAVFCGRTLPIPGYENTVGPTINSLPLHVKISRSTTVQHWLRDVFGHIARLFSLQWSTPAQDVSRKFDTALNVQLTPDVATDSPYNPIEPPFSTIMSDVPLQVDIASCGKIRLSYHTEMYSVAHIQAIADTFTQSLIMLQRPHSTMKECLKSLLPEIQLSRLSYIGNCSASTTRNDSTEVDLVKLFRGMAQVNPEGVAISQGLRTMSYGELDRRSTLVAERLTHLISPEDVVCVHADRSMDWIVAIYGVLKAGGVYCPFADDMPAAVKDVNFRTANARMFLTGSIEAKQAKPHSCLTCLSVEEILADMRRSQGLVSNVELSTSRPHAPAYLCFTSGSTGKPKGVLCRHRGLVAFQNDFEVRLRARPNWKIAQTMSPNFDGSIHEIFSALSYGANLVLKDPSEPLAHLKSADAAILTPSVAKVLNPSDYPRLSTLYLVGEAVPQSVCDTWAAKGTLYNMYGPTEATGGATIKQLHSYQTVTLGRPNPSTRIYILDSKQQINPPGVIGEIYLAGVQVAVGYVGRPDETAKRFLPDFVNPHFNEYMYRTGDRGYWTEDGELMFLGRGDRQIKLRGFRVDLDDIEIRILQCYPKAKGIAITLKDDGLVAQVQPANINMYEFREQIRKHVPAYAIPRHIVPVDSFPLTPVGKLDYKRIAAFDFDTIHMEVQRKMQSASERMVSTAVRHVLGLPKHSPIDLDSSFAALGGHSVLHLHLSHRLSRCFGCHIPLRLILEASTLRELAASVDLSKAENVVKETISTINADEYCLSPIELDWWEKYQQAGSSSFNVTYACKLGPDIDVSKLEEAWNTVLTRHRILRTHYQPCETHRARRIYHQQSPSVDRVGNIDIHREIHVSFNLRKDHLIRVLVSPTQMLVIVSHIICDLTTLRVLLDEVTKYYLGKSLSPISTSYSQVQWSIPTSSCHFPFWKEYLSNQRKLRYPVGNNGDRQSWAGTSHICIIPADIYIRMRTFSASRKVTMHQLSLAAVALALQHQSQTCDITLGAPYLNRNSEDDQNLVGLFLEPLPIRIQYDSNLTESESFIQSVQRNSRAALSHAVPWHQLLAHLDITPDFPNHPIFDSMVTFHDKTDSVDFAMPGTNPITTWTEGAKFKVMAEFTANKDGSLSLRLEYSTECFDEKDMKLLSRWISVALDGIVRDENFECIRRSVQSIAV